MTAGSDGKLYIGTAPVYGTHGGCLAVYDPVADGLTVHDRPAGSLSLVAAVFHDGILYAGTSVWGGLGIDPVENEAGLLVFPGGEGRPELIRLGIPGLHEVSAVTLGRDGLIWGMAEGYLFTYDPSVRAVTWKTLAFPEIMSYGKHYWRDAHLLQAEDGYIYGTVRLAEALFRVDPATKEITVLDRSGAFLLCDGGNGSLYYSDAASRLKRYSLLPHG
ncbi:hypothetical protein N6H14_12805 [Paenibacillus sp. CC-CFT747]|nr:hypothetical protein N6H14_12805 [Paenibacillus sp. CC-CFT747]